MAENEREIIEGKLGKEMKKINLISLAVASALTVALLALLILVPIFNNPNADEASGLSVDEAVSAEYLSEEPENAGSTDVSNLSGEISDEVSVPETEEITGWIKNKMGYTFMFKDRGLQQFNGTSGNAERYAASVNELASAIPDKRIYSMIVPTAVEYLYDEIPHDYRKDFFCRKQSAFVKSVSDTYSAGVVPVDIVELLGKHSEEYIYFNTDTNWTSLAAYYAYTAFIEACGKPCVDIQDCREGVNELYLGQFYYCASYGTDDDSLKAAEILYNNADSVYYYVIPEGENIRVGGYLLTGNSVSGSRFGYFTFLGTASAKYTVKTGYSGGKLLVIGDSSVPPILQFLAYDYSEICYLNIDMYTGDLSDFGDYDDVLIMTYATNAATPSYCEKIKSYTGN